MLVNKLFYTIKPFIPRPVQIELRRIITRRKRKLYSKIWPIDRDAGDSPEGWKGWPDNKRLAIVLTHDVDTEKGHGNCHDLASMEKKLGFRSSFNFVPERYNVSSELRNDLVKRGFEVGVHGLYHDGKLYKSREIFKERAVKINQYLKKWGAVGFRSPAMHHNLDWIHDLNIEYDASTFDTDPFEPQSDGIGTIFPFLVIKDFSDKRYVEIPYTLPQDFTLFVLMEETTVDIWKKKLDWIAVKGGMALINTHPDYMNFDGQTMNIEEYPAAYYREFLEYIKSEYDGQYWHVLPGEMSRFWAENMDNKMKSDG